MPEKLQFESKEKIDFKLAKKAALEFLAKEGVKGQSGIDIKDNIEIRPVQDNEGKLDDNVRELVHRFNELPFMYTTGSCGGHVFEGGRGIPVGKALYAGGDIHFVIDNGDESQSFINHARKIVEEHADSGADFYLDSRGGYILFSRSYGKKKIDIVLARELEVKKEELKSKINDLALKFLNDKKN